MKKLLFISATLASLIILVLSRAAYQEKLNSISSNASNSINVENSADEEPDSPAVTAEQSSTSTSHINGTIASWMEDNPDEDTIQITYFGSVSLVNEENESTSWPNLVTDSVDEQVPSIKVSSSIVEAGRSTTDVVLEEGYVDEVIATNPDIIVFEPFILNNNGNIFIDDSLEMTKSIMSLLEQSSPRATIVLIPSNPLYNTVNYEGQINSFKSFAEENEYFYANHWEAWPPTDSEDLQEFITDGRPNTDGHEIWAKYMIDYLTTD